MDSGSAAMSICQISHLSILQICTQFIAINILNLCELATYEISVLTYLYVCSVRKTEPCMQVSLFAVPE